MIKTAASVLSRDPPIFYVRPRPAPFGLAGLIASRSRGIPMTCIVRTMWTLEAEHHLMELIFIHANFTARQPHIRVIIAANTQKEVDLLQEAGVEAVLANHNIFVDEKIFRPMPAVERSYDAIYNANFSPFKRRALSAEIPRCVHLGYVADPGAKDDMAAQYRAAQAELPHHDFLNGVDGTKVLRLPPRAVNQALATAHVGLCLSEMEGAMVASMEYLLAGLPLVTTPNLGGRDRYFTPETAVTAEPNPRAIREAVEALKARDIPRQVIRRKTLELVERDRQRFNAFIDGLREGHAPITADPRWHCEYTGNLYRWRPVEDFAAALGLPPADAGVEGGAPWYDEPADRQ